MPRSQRKTEDLIVEFFAGANLVEAQTALAYATAIVRRRSAVVEGNKPARPAQPVSAAPKPPAKAKVKVAAPVAIQTAGAGRKAGRPPGAKNKPKDVPLPGMGAESAAAPVVDIAQPGDPGVVAEVGDVVS